MGSQAASLLYLVVMVTVVVVVDWRFLRRHFWWRLAVNVGIVLVFLAVYLGVRAAAVIAATPSRPVRCLNA